MTIRTGKCAHLQTQRLLFRLGPLKGEPFLWLWLKNCRVMEEKKGRTLLGQGVM